ncbi:hypothetical protein HDV05_004341 [Chytridiales sp. JEL 0842]|nr:hypothetical protein HDV05_004341 [Chytridiales sp. JEL 0842]
MLFQKMEAKHSKDIEDAVFEFGKAEKNDMHSFGVLWRYKLDVKTLKTPIVELSFVDKDMFPVFKNHCETNPASGTGVLHGGDESNSECVVVVENGLSYGTNDKKTGSNIRNEGSSSGLVQDAPPAYQETEV